MKGATLRLLDEDDAERLKPFRLQALTDGYEAFHSSPEEWDLPIEAFRDFIRSGKACAAFDGRLGDVMPNARMKKLSYRDPGVIKRLPGACHIGPLFSTFSITSP